MTAAFLVALVIAQAQAQGQASAAAPSPPPTAPAVSVWYRGTPAGMSRQDDLAIIRALGFTAVTWPESGAAGLDELRRQAEVIGLAVFVAPPPPAAATPLPAGAIQLVVTPSDARDRPNVTAVSPADLAAHAWRAIARGARALSFDAGAATGAGVVEAGGERASWVAPALAVVRQLSFNERLFSALRPAAAVTIERPAPASLDIVLKQDDRSWVIFATNTGRDRVRAVARFPPGVPPALWSNLLDGAGMSMLAQPDGARWSLDLEGGAARIYIVNKY